MGYVPTPTAAADQYMSLSQGIVDGADHALWAHQTWKLTEIAKHYSDTRHALQCVFFIMNNDSLASLPEEYQKIVLDTFAEVEKELADQTRKDSDESYVKAEADGVKVIPYEEIDIDSFKQALSGRRGRVFQPRAGSVRHHQQAGRLIFLPPLPPFYPGGNVGFKRSLHEA